MLAQNVSLYHSGTQFDSFENPVQQSFIKDDSRKFAITLLPHTSGYFGFEGNAESAFKRLLFTRDFKDSKIGSVNIPQNNYIHGNVNIYLFNYRIYKTRQYNREIGFSLQLRNEGQGTTKDGVIAIFDSYKKFANSMTNNPFNSKGSNQSYWQLGLTYRENYNDTWGFGAKISLLSGLIYNGGEISSSSLNINGNSFVAKIAGEYRSSFGIKTLEVKDVMPSFDKLGAGLSLATSFTTPSEFYFTLNVKDLGFIHWGKNTSNYRFDSEVNIQNADSAAYSRFTYEIQKDLRTVEVKKSYYSHINTKFEFAVSKEFNFYKPVLVVTKSAFGPAGQIALINNFRKNIFSLSINPIYDLESKLNLGTQLLIKSPNAEFYIGTEQLFPSYYLAKSYLTKNEQIGTRYPRAGFYIGLNIKFGPKMQSIGTADEIPGLNSRESGFMMR